MASGSIAPDRFERLLAILTLILLSAAALAVVRGRSEWDQISPVLWLHLGTLSIALALTPVMLLRRRGDRLHRALGWIWAVAMLITAILSFGIRMINAGSLSPIHILSAVILITVPLLIWRARTHKVAAHRRGARVIVTFGLLGAGVATFPFDRLLGHWLLG